MVCGNGDGNDGSWSYLVGLMVCEYGHHGNQWTIERNHDHDQNHNHWWFEVSWFTIINHDHNHKPSATIIANDYAAV